MAYSENCLDLQTYWNRSKGKCVPCDMRWMKPGFEFTPNCGYADNGGRPDSRTQRCADGSYNDGQHRSCRTCAYCPKGRRVAQQCNGTMDTLCCQKGNDCDTATADKGVQLRTHSALWMASIFILACVVAGAIYYIVCRRKRRSFKDGNQNSSNTNSSSAIDNLAFCNQRDGEGTAVLSPRVQSAPLRVVLDDLDVLEELIVLLDPEGNGVKCTRHLASHCSFPATWVNYAYSLRDSRSPLKTLLEGITTQHPDWTVGDLSRLLGEMGRLDAVVVLTKLRPPVDTV